VAVSNLILPLFLSKTAVCQRIPILGGKCQFAIDTAAIPILGGKCQFAIDTAYFFHLIAKTS
jgi:hypothetical protein